MKESGEYLMNRPEKLVWFILSICILSIAGFIVTIPTGGLKAAPGMFGLIGFTGLAPWLYRNEGLPDERDRCILNSAQRVGFLIFWLSFVVSLIGIWSWYVMHSIETIPVYILPLTVSVPWALLYTVQTAATIIQYRRGDAS